LEQVYAVNALGQQIAFMPKGNTNEFTPVFRLKDIPAGVYTIKIKADGLWHQRRITVQ
jgi:hypothetical protein